MKTRVNGRHFAGVKRLAMCLSTTALTGLAGAGTALAQQDAPAVKREAMMERMIITAQKREESLQDVPVAVTLLDSALIEASYSRNIESLANAVPTLNFRKGNTTRNSALFLRGIGTISFSTAAEPSVSTVVDGVVLARSGMAFSDLYDIERIEILRGPQGTLFGKNASAGVLNIVTKRPGDVLGGEVSVSGFEEGEYRVNGSFDVPITDDLRSRFSVFYGSFDGNITNQAPLTEPSNDEDRINGYDHIGFRGLVEWDAAPGVRFTLIGDYSEEEDDCCADVLTTPPDDSPLGLVLTDLLTERGALPTGLDTRVVDHDLVTQTISQNAGLSLQADWDILPTVSLTSITAWRSWDNREIREGDFLSVGPSTLLDTTTGVQSPGTIQLHDDGPQEFRQFSQEIRFTSSTGGRFEWQAGLFYFNVESDRQFTRFTEVCLESASAPIAEAGGFQLLPCDESDPGFLGASATADFSTTFNNFGLFAQATYDILEDLRLTGGIRYNYDEVSFEHRRVNPTGVPLPGVRAEDFAAEGDTDASAVTGKAALQYDLTPDLTAYVSYARGYKGPAFNTFFNMIDEDTIPIEEETSNSYEGGLKASLLNGSLAASITGFYAAYNNFQANNFVIINEQVTTNLTNAGDVSTRGVELDVFGSITDQWSVSGGFAYTDARVDESNAPPAAGMGSFSEGARLAFAPKYALSAATEYVVPLPFADLDVYLNSDVSWRSGQRSSIGPEDDLDIDAYGLWNASIGVGDRDDTYRLTFIVKNITDTQFETINVGGGPAGTTRTQIPREADRFIGVNLRARFGG
ncbi:MAG: TonB-dependent receptor [Alphaproteobacteria bacterium]